MALALMKNYDPFKAPTHFKLVDLMKKFDKTFGATGKQLRQGRRATGPRPTSHKRRADRWNFLFIAGMWFQDLFNYDFRRTERCIIPYATQEGEISFCAYNTGHRLAEHHREDAHDGHADQVVRRARPSRDLRRRQEGRAPDAPITASCSMPRRWRPASSTISTTQGIAKTAREEKMRAKADASKKVEENERMAALYRQHVLKEEPAGAPDPGSGRQEEGPGPGSPAQQPKV